MSIYKFNAPNPDAYIIRCHNQEYCDIQVHGVSGDIDAWTSTTHKTEAEAYLEAYVWLRKKQIDELHKLECEMARKGIEGFPSNATIFHKRYPNLQKTHQRERLDQIQKGIKERLDE
jgi:hypothetical protein